ncbi:ABC transporter permease, partial [Mesorhizobium sp. M7A.T.Ca.TU.009.01.3.1]
MKTLRNLQGPALTLALLCMLWLIVIVGLLALRPSVFNLGTVTTILQFSTILALVGLGQGLVIMAGGAGIDLSVGGAVSLSAIVAMLCLKLGLPPVLLPVVCILAGVLLGALNGWLVNGLALLPFIATLGTFFVYSGAALAITGGAAQAGVPSWLLVWGRGVVMGIPLPFLTLAIPCFALAGLVLLSTAWG